MILVPSGCYSVQGLIADIFRVLQKVGPPTFLRAHPGDGLTIRSICVQRPEQPGGNTTGPMGKLLLNVLGAVAECGPGLRRERQLEAIA